MTRLSFSARSAIRIIKILKFEVGKNIREDKSISRAARISRRISNTDVFSPRDCVVRETMCALCYHREDISLPIFTVRIAL